MGHDRLVDEECPPKPAFTALKKLIKGEWLTPPATLRTDADGEIAWHGFYGEYTVELQQPGRRHLSRRVHLAQDEENRWVFRG